MQTSPLVSVADASASLPATPPGWRIGSWLAAGGSSLVHVATDAVGREAVIKVARRREMTARFAAEAAALRALPGHVGPALIASGEVDGLPYLILERVEGETLADWMARNGGRGSFAEVLALLTRLAAALAEIHRAGFVHADLKPENLVNGARGTRVLDFGLARRASAAPVTGTTAAGTLHYMAPEQLRVGAGIDQRADVYAFGVIAFEMLAGVPPFVGDPYALEYQHQFARPPALADRRKVPESFAELVQACLAKQPEPRPRDGDDLVRQLRGGLAGQRTVRGTGGTAGSPAAPAAPEPALGTHDEVALAWVAGVDVRVTASAVSELAGSIVREHGDALLVAFCRAHHDSPVNTAVEAVRTLRPERAVVHATSALVRRSRGGKLAVYGDDIAEPSRWLPSSPLAGVVLTDRAAAAIASGVEPAAMAGFWRERVRGPDQPPLVGREAVLRELIGALAQPSSGAIVIVGGAGIGKTRVLATLGERLRAAGREVLVVRARPRFFGELGDGSELAAVEDARARGILALVDDAHVLAPAARTALLARAAVVAGEGIDAAGHHVIELPLLGFADADRLLREMLRPARLLPAVLIERLAVRAGGHPATLAALAGEIHARGAIRRHAGSSEWYVAADELDTLPTAPGPSWLATRALEDLGPAAAAIAATCAALGPMFCRGELAAIAGGDAHGSLAALLESGVLVDADGWLAFRDPSLQALLADQVGEARELVHRSALAYWQARPEEPRTRWIARLAHHASRAPAPQLAAACWLALAEHAAAAGDRELADRLIERAGQVASIGLPAPIVAALRSLGRA